VRQQVGEVLDQDGGCAQLALLVGRGDFLPGGIGDVQRVADAIADRSDQHPPDVNPVHGQRVGELVQKADRVGRVDAQDGVALGGGVVDLDVDGIQRRRGPGDVVQATATRLANSPRASRRRPACIKRSRAFRSAA